MDVPDRMSSTTDLLSSLSDCYSCLLGGSRPKPSSAHIAGLLYSGVCVRVPGGDAAWQLACLSLTLLRKLCGCGSAQQTDVLLLLLERSDLMSQLVQHFQAEDQVLSHLAAKAASACVSQLLCNRGAASPAWQQKCLQAFSRSDAGPEVDACIWSLTDVLKNLLRHSHQGLLGELVAAFDCSLTALSLKLLPGEKTESSFSGARGTTLCLLLDLLEVLTITGLVCGSGVRLRIQRIPGIHSAALLTTISCCSEYFVKKRLLLLLKRVLLHKLGEDWSLEGVIPRTREDQAFSADRCVLAQSILKAVAGNWLQTVQVERAVFFGGVQQNQDSKEQKADGTVLRAVGLVLLKSVELHLHTDAAAGSDVTTESASYLRRLWTFLNGFVGAQTEITHPCSWISLLFGEQDDDLMEAASAALSIFLTYRQRSRLDDHSVLEEACAFGCNPHCHFVLLLQSLSFDHSILLDFLISSETCFLEYFVRYLKLLRKDWRGFTAACRCGTAPPPRAPSSGCLPAGAAPALERSGLCTGLRLVEYDSSDESSEETPTRPRPVADSDPKPSSSVLQSQRACLTSDTLHRAVSCLSQLRAVVARLQTKKLFPYNPSSLLKLLAHVENCYQSLAF